MEGYSIRAAEPEDEWDEIAAMHKACFDGWAINLKPDKGWWWLVWRAGVPVGFCSLHKSVIFPGAGFLSRSGILPAHRGRGLQRRMIRVRERQARALGMGLMTTYTKSNPPSANSLIGCGYRMHEPKEFYAGEDAQYWRRSLVLPH